MAKRFGHYAKMIPTGLEDNIRWRIAQRKRAKKDPRFRKAVLRACQEDILYLISGWFWVFEPRPLKRPDGSPMPSKIPFIVWPHQIPILESMDENLGYYDIGVEKSRGEGMSWLGVTFAFRDWLFEPHSKVSLVSRNMESADNPDDPDSLFWKIDFQLANLPNWMRPEYKRLITSSILKNQDNGATIAAYATTGDVTSGGRARWMLIDELSKHERGPDVELMASTQHVTNSRLIISTPKGASGAYYEIMHEASSMVKLKLHWSENPTRNRGLYRVDDYGQIEYVDPIKYGVMTEDYLKRLPEIHARLKRKGYQLSAGPRSPWYDTECDRPRATPQSIAQELDLDYGGSDLRFFSGEFMNRASKTAIRPFTYVRFDYEPNTLEPEVTEVERSQFRCWFYPDGRCKPPKSKYVAGCDVSAGLGGSHTSNSAIVVIDSVSREQVFEFASNSIRPEEFADLAIAVCKWFHDAYLIWENNGAPGSMFTAQVMERGYGNVYRMKDKLNSSKRSRKMGWRSMPSTRHPAFMSFRAAVSCGDLVLRSPEIVEECGQYVMRGGKAEHVAGKYTTDESSKGEAHGDMAIAGIVCWVGVEDRPSAPPPSETRAVTLSEIENGMYEGDGRSIAGRLSEAAQEQMKENSEGGWHDW